MSGEVEKPEYGKYGETRLCLVEGNGGGTVVFWTHLARVLPKATSTARMTTTVLWPRENHRPTCVFMMPWYSHEIEINEGAESCDQ